MTDNFDRQAGARGGWLDWWLVNCDLLYIEDLLTAALSV